MGDNLYFRPFYVTVFQYFLITKYPNTKYSVAVNPESV